MADEKKCNCGCEDAANIFSDANIEMLKRKSEEMKQMMANGQQPQLTIDYGVKQNKTADGADMYIAEIIADYTDDHEFYALKRKAALLDEKHDRDDEIAYLQKIMELQTDLLVQKILRLSTQPCTEQEVKQMVEGYNNTLDYIRASNDTGFHFDKEKSDVDSLRAALLGMCDEYKESATTLMIYKASGLAR
jgi:hypothetical protein